MPNAACNNCFSDCVIQSPQNRRADVPYNNLVVSLEDVRKAGERIAGNVDAESNLALQNARNISAVARSVSAECVSVSGRRSNVSSSRSLSVASLGSQERFGRATNRLSGSNQGGVGLLPVLQENSLSHRGQEDPEMQDIGADAAEADPLNIDTSAALMKKGEILQETEMVGTIPDKDSPPKGVRTSSANSGGENQGSGYGSSVVSGLAMEDAPSARPNASRLQLEAQRLLESHGFPTEELGRFTSSRGHKRALIWAATEGHVEAVKFLIAKGTIFDIQSETGAKALYAAIDSGNTEVVKYLLSLVDQVEVKGSFQAHNALFAAARRGDYAVLGILLDKGADPNSKDRNKSTPLHVAAHHGFLNVVRQLLLKDANVYAKDETQSTALHIAIAAGSVAVTRTLLEYRSEINVKDSHGDTPFHIAFRAAKADIFNNLIESSAKRQLTNDEFARSATLDELVRGKHGLGFRIFVQCLHEQNLLTYAHIEEVVHIIALGNHRDALRYLRDEEVLTGPHFHESGNEETKKELEREEEKPRSHTRKPSLASITTALSLPVYEKYYRYNGVDVLYEHEDTLDDQHSRNEHFLRLAVTSKDGRAFRQTLDMMKPAPGHPHWPVSATTLCCVVKAGDLAMLQALFWTKVDINGTDSDGWAAIHYAAYVPNLYNKLLALQSAGADPNVKTSAFHRHFEAGETALGLALSRKEKAHPRDKIYWDRVFSALHSKRTRSSARFSHQHGSGAGSSRQRLVA